MSRRPSPILWCIAAIVVASAAWLVISPRRAWHEFLRAIAQNDAAALTTIVDYPVIRAQAAVDLSAAIAQQANGKMRIPPQMRQDLMQQMVDSMLSPHGLLQLVNSFSLTPGAGESVPTSFHYHGISHVDVLLGGSGNSNAGLFTFERTRMHWRLIRASSQRIAALTSGS